MYCNTLVQYFNWQRKFECRYELWIDLEIKRNENNSEGSVVNYKTSIVSSHRKWLSVYYLGISFQLYFGRYSDTITNRIPQYEFLNILNVSCMPSCRPWLPVIISIGDVPTLDLWPRLFIDISIIWLVMTWWAFVLIHIRLSTQWKHSRVLSYSNTIKIKY